MHILEYPFEIWSIDRNQLKPKEPVSEGNLKTKSFVGTHILKLLKSEPELEFIQIEQYVFFRFY